MGDEIAKSDGPGKSRVKDPAWSAWSGLITESAACLLWTSANEVHVGSGTILGTPEGRTVILTAKHVVVASLEHGGRIVCKSGSGALFESRAVLHPDASVDVALVLPSPDLEAALQRHAEPASTVAACCMDGVRPPEGFDDAYAVMGYPIDMTSPFHANAVFGINGYLWLCNQREPPIHRPDDDLVEFEWVASGRALRGIDGAERENMIAPESAHGMSGGALWRRRYLRDRFLSNGMPAVVCEIVAVQREYRPSSRALFLDPSERWHGWLQQVMRQLDRDSAR